MNRANNATPLSIMQGSQMTLSAQIKIFPSPLSKSSLGQHHFDLTTFQHATIRQNNLPKLISAAM